MKHQIRLEDWIEYDCEEGCCASDYGTRLIINGQNITDYFEGTDTDIKIILEAFNIEYEFIDEENPKDNQ